MDTTLIITSPTESVRRYIDRSGVAPYTSWHDRLEIPAETALALLRLDLMRSSQGQDVYQQMGRAAEVQGFIAQYNSEWYRTLDGERHGFGWATRGAALRAFCEYAIEVSG